jgi:parallel beta-helix repeat protein
VSAATINVPSDYPTIQAAVIAASPGDTINVAAGTYIEQVVINKNLTLIGIGNPTIQAPAAVPFYTFPEGGTRQWEPVVLAFGGTLVGSAISGAGQVTVNISGFIVDGNSRVPSPLARRAVGILYRNVLGGVDGCIVQNMGYSTAGINSWGIMAYGTSDVIFHGNNVSGYAKGGFVVNGVASNPSLPKPNAVIDGNIVTGPPIVPSMTLAPNGIQIGWGATGSMTNNIVTHNGWPGTDWVGTGLLVQSSPDVVVEGNTVTDNEVGIAVTGYRFYGGSYSTGTIIRNNRAEHNSQGIRVSGNTVDTTIQGNTITANEYGIHVNTSDYRPEPPVNPVMIYNAIYCNTIAGLAVENENDDPPVVVAIPVNAINNWWGCNDGPGVIGPGSGDRISDSTGSTPSFSPWLVLKLSANPPNILAVDTSTITADMTDNSNGVDSGGYIPDGTEIVFTTTKGSIGSLTTTKTTTNGIATAVFTSDTTPGDVTIFAKAPTCYECANAINYQGETYAVSVNVNTVPVAGKSAVPSGAAATTNWSWSWTRPPEMSVQYVSVKPQQSYANQPVTVLTNVVNTGDEGGNYNLVLKINGRVEQTRMVSVGPQGTQPVKFTVTKSQPGTYTVDIAGQKGSFTVLGAGSSTGSNQSSGLIALIVMTVLILSTVVVLMMTFRRSA